MKRPPTSTLFASVNLIGDTLTQMPALKRYRETHPHEHVTWLLHDIPTMQLFRGAEKLGVCDELAFYSNPEDPGDSSAISEMTALKPPHCLVETVFAKKILLECRQAWRVSLHKNEHLSQGYARCLGTSIAPHEIIGELPDAGTLEMPTIEKPLPFSINSASNDPVDGDGFSGNKNFPVKGWVELLKPFRRAGYTPLLLQGPEDSINVPGVTSVRFPLSMVAAFIRRCGIYAGVDNGITHIAAWTGARCFVIYPQCLPVEWVGYSNFPHYHLSRLHPFHGDVDRVLRDWRKFLP